MKKWGLIFLLLSSRMALAQTENFPADWVGHWKGELAWYKNGKPLPQKINMELIIQPTDSAEQYTWQIIYGTKEGDYRPYILKPIDKNTGHWVIDELSGIVLDQYWLGQKFSGAFTVQKSTIINSYWMVQDSLFVEFYNIGATSLHTTGKGTEDVPFVDSYFLGSYQKAVLGKEN